jgi:peroxin-19
MEKKPEDSEGVADAPGKAAEKETEALPISKDPASAAVPKPKDPAPVEEVPDPDEDDLDDLDG